MKDMRSEKAEKILRMMKKRDRKAAIPYDGPPDIDFIVQKTTEGTGEKVLREFNHSTLDDVGPCPFVWSKGSEKGLLRVER